jgi:hypothetical protein
MAANWLLADRRLLNVWPRSVNNSAATTGWDRDPARLQVTPEASLSLSADIHLNVLNNSYEHVYL